MQKLQVCNSFLSVCHRNWRRETYQGVRDIDIPQPTLTSVQFDSDETNYQHYLNRFRQIIPYLSKQTLNRILFDCESEALQPQNSTRVRIPSPACSPGFSNPPVRTKKKRKFIDYEFDSESE